MSTTTTDSEIIAYIKIELSVINDKIGYYQTDLNINKKDSKYFELMESLNNQKEIVSRILKVSQNLLKE
ncbi:hypothetical protein ACE193_25375 (plasmid) [Bernardetia sp. OM2101]|uniref:hypothetical protein n=1 Tax=Bernardetia sp. OM2101 TaxID=3344876 RepID=UPI0035CFFE8A